MSMLTGTALKAEATRLAIPGRSRMSAADLRTAIAATQAALAAADPTPLDDSPEVWVAEMATRNLSERGGTPVPQQRPQVATDPLPPLDGMAADDWRRDVRAIMTGTPTPASFAAPTPATFAARWGKRKPSLNGRTRRRSN
jgi:hypothetical protein